MYSDWGNYFNRIRIGCECVVSVTLGDVSMPTTILEQALDFISTKFQKTCQVFFLKVFSKKVSFKLQKGTVVLIQDLY